MENEGQRLVGLNSVMRLFGAKSLANMRLEPKKRAEVGKRKGIVEIHMLGEVLHHGNY